MHGAGTAERREPLGFQKYEGLGNDFVVIETERDDVVSLGMARSLCDRRLGIGADGVLLVLPSTSANADARMKVINADGSIPEMCGNGLRCVALHTARNRGMTHGTLTFDTDAGVKPCVIDDRDGRGSVTVNMGVVRFVEDVTIDIDDDSFRLALGNAGNPHAITRQAISREDFNRVGPRIATHSRFPAGTNVELVTMISPTEIDVLVWERGVGITQACGTGACATVAVAVAKGWSPANTDIDVRLLGGVLSVRLEAETGHAIMRGPARHVFTGSITR